MGAPHGGGPEPGAHIVHVELHHGVKGHITGHGPLLQELLFVGLGVLLPGEAPLFLLALPGPVHIVKLAVPGAALLVFVCWYWRTLSLWN